MTTFEEVRPVADAVLYEGYVLYPYRADDGKNRVRWQFGVLAPPALADTDPSERSHLRAEVLLEARPETIDLRLRFLQVQRRTVERAVGGTSQDEREDAWEEVASLDAGDTAYLPFDEAVSHDVDARFRVADIVLRDHVEAVSVPGGAETETVPGGRLVRERVPLEATLHVGAEELPGPYGVTRVRVVVTNRTPWDADPPLRREDALRRSLVAAHLLARVDAGRFLSLTDPPEWSRGYVDGCDNEGVWPVLAGEEGASDLVLCSPIILPDHPQVAPESTTDFFDATEIDEMLSLRTLTLTDDEKRAVRGTDPRAAELLDRVETLPPELMERLHGAVRHLGRNPRRVGAAGAEREPERAGEDDEPIESVDVDGVAVREGSRVLLRPGVRRSDAQDVFLAGRTATVTRVLRDLDGHEHVAVLLDDDPGQDVALAHGRFLYFAPDELQPLGVMR